MKYATAVAFRTALERRLLTRSRETGMSLARLRKSVVFDRLLARLVAVAPNRWMLKGALALDYRLGPGTRTTKDIDLGRRDDEEGATADFVSAQAADLGDHFVFVFRRTDRLDQLKEGAAVRYHVECQLAGRQFEAVIVDVAFGESMGDEPETLRGPDLLAFADIAPVEVPAVSLSQHVAEKVHAYARDYGTDGIQSTRVKDLVDLVLIAEGAPLDAANLRSALQRTFEGRGTRRLPAELPSPPETWRIPYRKMAGDIGLATELDAGHYAAAELLNPVLSGSVASGTWDPASRSWR